MDNTNNITNDIKLFEVEKRGFILENDEFSTTLGRIKCADSVTTEFQTYEKFYKELKNNNIESLTTPVYSDCGKYGNKILYITGKTKDNKDVSLIGTGDNDKEMLRSYNVILKCMDIAKNIKN